MKNSTFSAQVANNLLTLLQGYSKTIRLLLVMFLTLTVTTNAWGAEETATLSFASTAQRVSQTTTKQVWSSGGITFTNNKASSTTNVANYSSPVRLYANSEVIVEHTSGKMTKIVFDCNSTDYANTMKTSIGTVSGATVSVSSDKVTVTFTSAAASFTVAKLSGQIRLDAITVTYTAGGGSTPDPTTYTIKWHTAKGVTTDVTLNEGATITKPATDPTMSGYVFMGWTEACEIASNGSDFTAISNFGTATEDKDYYAVFAKATTSGSGGETGSVTMKYSGSTTTNMSIGNNAATVGLDANKWSVVPTKGSASNMPGLNKDGDIRLYGHASGGNYLTISSASYTITGVEITYTSNSYNNGKFYVNGTETTASNINANEFVIKNANSSTTQVRIKTLVINYTGGGGTTTYDNYITTCAGAEPEPDPIHVTSVSLDKTSHTMKEGETVNLTATVTPDNADDKTVSWKSDNEAVAKVNTNGVVTAVSPGTATITVTTTDGGKTATCAITVKALPTVEGTWTLVTNAANLKAGDRIVIAAADSVFALSTTQNNNNRGQAAVTKNGNNITFTEATQIITLEATGESTVPFAFNVGTAGYLYAAAANSNYLKTKTTLDDHGKWAITINADTASIIASMSTNRNVMQYNKTNGLFACYASASQEPIAIYKEASGTPDPIKLATPENLSVSGVTASSATLTWNEVEHASSYIVNLEGNEHETNTNSLTLNELTASTTYKWTVKAKGDGINYSDSENSSQSSFTTDAATYTITYVTNGGTKVESTSGTALPDPLPTTTRDHYTFAGWYTDEGCTQAAIAGATINANTTLYAKWTPVTYTVTFDAGSGTCATEPTQGNFETGITLPTATPCPYAQENGWSFVGWSESTVSETTVRPAILTGNYKPTKTITLHAVYAKTGAAQGAAGEFILSLQYEGTTYYVGQTFDNSKLSAETEQTNAARFTIEDNYLHYEGGYISHVSTSGSTNITRQANKEDAQAWTIAENGNTITFTSTADDTRGLGFNYNDGSPRFAAYKLNEKEKDGETIKYPSTFTKTSVSGGNVQVTTYNSNPSCEAPVDPTWVDAQITHTAIKANCGSTTVLGSEGENGPATISFGGTDLQSSVTVTASDGFLVSTDKTAPEKYAKSVIIYPNSTGNNIGQITQNVHVIAQAPAQSGNYDGTITLTGNDIPGGSQVINVTAAVTCTQYTITWSVSGDETQKTTFYAGGDWELPENPTFNCNGRVFVGWTNNEIVQPQDIAPNVLYKEQGEFPTIESDITFYAVFAQEGTGDGSGTATVTDLLNQQWTEVSGTTYKDWSEKTATSSAVYAGNSAGGYESIQLRSDASKDAAGIITTTSGGKATKVTVVWNNQTADGRTLNVYGKNSAYSAVADLRDENKRGTLLGTIVKGTSTSLTINDDYEYIGLCSNSGAMYLTSIAITWATDGEGDGNATTYTSYTTSCADVKAIRIVEPTTKTFNEGDKFVFDGEVWAINSDDTETNVTNSQLVHFVYDMNKVGTQTVTVSYLGFTATYEITINAVEKWQITWNVSGVTNTGLSPAAVAKGNTIGKLPKPKAIPNGCEGKTFVGWTESNTVNSDGTDITFITSSTVPTQNTTYYAVFATPSGNAGDGDYVKVTEDANDLSGEYLIVYEEGNLAFNGGLTTLDAASNTISVTIDDNTIESTDATDAAKFTITKNGDAYIITSASNYHIGQTSDANGLQSSTSTSYTNTITITEDSANIIGEGGAYLRYNKTSSINNGKETGLRFRYYKSASYTYQQPIALYKKSGSSASYTDYTTGCHDVTITYYGFTGGYTTNCGGSDLNVITQRVNSAHTIPNCTEITDPTDLGRTFLNLWKDQNGKVHQPGESFIVTQDITLYAQWKLETTGNITLPADKEDLATTDIVVTGGKTLTIPEGETITINSLTLKGGLLGEDSNSGYAMPSVVIPDGAKLVRKNTTINLDLVVNNDSWYPFAVPFAIDDNSNIDYLDPVLKAASTYNTHFAIKTYDGANRAIVGTDQENNWDKVKQTAGLQPGKGYIISALTYPDKDTATIRIPMTVPNEWLTNGEQTTVNEVTRNQVTVTAYTGDAATEHQRHAGWNFVANPYLANFAGTNASGSFINGEILINKGDYSYSDEEVPYVTIPTYNFAHYYQVKLSEATLSPAYSFFVQVGESGTMTFDVAGRQAAPASIAARNAEERPVKMDVDITLSDNHSSDQTGIIISDRYSEAYEIGRDLEKLFGSAYNLSVYTLMADNTPLAFQALAIRSNMQVIPVGYRTPAQGEYTFRLNEATSSIDLLNEQYEQLVLVDYQTGELTNLLISDYTFYSERTQADNRFAIYAVPRQNAPTDLPNAIGQDKQAQKIIHNGHLYILRDGNVYNGNGQIVK